MGLLGNITPTTLCPYHPYGVSARLWCFFLRDAQFGYWLQKGWSMTRTMP